VLLAVFGLGGIAAFPAVAGVAIAAIAWRTPSAQAKELADKARAAFRTNLEFFLTLVAGERRARGSVEQALDEAVRVSGTGAFVAMRRVIRRADLAGEKPWAALRRLGEELAVPELKNLSDIAATAADGAAVYQSLLAAARTLRHTELAQARTEANLISERMARPLSLLGVRPDAVRDGAVRAAHARQHLTENHRSRKGPPGMANTTPASTFSRPASAGPAIRRRPS
jgi:Flp pilus assembly protein TadB